MARGALIPALAAIVLVVLTELIGWTLHTTGWSFLDRIDTRLPPGSYETLTAAVTAVATLLALFYTTVAVVVAARI